MLAPHVCDWRARSNWARFGCADQENETNYDSYMAKAALSGPDSEPFRHRTPLTLYMHTEFEVVCLGCLDLRFYDCSDSSAYRIGKSGVAAYRPRVGSQLASKRSTSFQTNITSREQSDVKPSGTYT